MGDDPANDDDSGPGDRTELNDDAERESDEDRRLRRAVHQWEQTERLRAMSPEEFAEEFAATRERTRLEELFWADQVAASEEEMWRDICEDLDDDI